ncbi:hypothetical protein PAHAL_5G086600 [Panicum hallii]|uniref:Uncharacterized protein n=1 Tax=Panicum hallii TaxID=206008 RepID=A0A2S3HQ35_9POAL|nr:hypothetical protein PAHAL_5G086600 [Panicum hallii]
MTSSAPPPASSYVVGPYVLLLGLRFDCYREIARSFPTFVNATNHRGRQPRRRPQGCLRRALMRKNAIALTAPKHSHQRCWHTQCSKGISGGWEYGTMGDRLSMLLKVPFRMDLKCLW